MGYRVKARNLKLKIREGTWKLKSETGLENKGPSDIVLSVASIVDRKANLHFLLTETDTLK
jgi:hypothetical protein